MKKFLTVLLVVLMALSMTGCKKDEPQDKNVKIGFVSDVGGIDDKSFNQTTWAGLVKFAEEIGLVKDTDYKFIESKSDADYDKNIESFIDEGYDLIACAGYMFADSVAAVAKANPEQKILVIDVNWIAVEEAPNVKQVGFNVEQGSFLVGYAAGLEAQKAGSNKVGMVIGGEGASMDPFYAGYQQGVWAANPDCEIYYWCANNDYGSPEKGKAQAKIMFDAGCTVVFGCAGATGNGVITEAAERRANGENVWAIGVDTDQYHMGYYDKEQTKSAVLTSMMKRVDFAMYDAAKEVKEGTFKGGVYTYNLANNGVGVPDSNPNLSEETIKAINDIKAEIVAGTKVVSATGVYQDTDARVHGYYGAK